MATPKSLGANPRPNARPVTSVNQRPAQPKAPAAPAYGRKAPAAPMQQRPVQAQAPRPAASASAAPKSMQGATANMRNTVPPVRQVNVQAEQRMKNDAIAGFVSQMKDMVGGFAILSEETLNRNMQLMAGNGMTYDDRTISFECVDYVISNLAYIFMGLVLDHNFKDSFMDALNVEMQIDSQPPEVKEKTRKQMRDANQYKSTGSLVLGVTTFMPNIANELMGKMQAGFKRLDPFAAEFDAEVAKMPTEAKVELGYIFSNFMYLVRAFSHNDMFMSYVITVIEKVKGITSGGGQ